MHYIQIILFKIHENVFFSENMSEPNDKRRKMETSKDPQVWLKWFEELLDNDIPEDESDFEEVDHTSDSEHVTESEQEASETEEAAAAADPIQNRNDFN